MLFLKVPIEEDSSCMACIRHGGIILYFYKKCIEMSGEEGTR
jgi:hypothetical protein